MLNFKNHMMPEVDATPMSAYVVRGPNFCSTVFWILKHVFSYSSFVLTAQRCAVWVQCSNQWKEYIIWTRTNKKTAKMENQGEMKWHIYLIWMVFNFILVITCKNSEKGDNLRALYLLQCLVTFSYHVHNTTSPMLWIYQSKKYWKFLIGKPANT